jgi:hypothetical protein
MGETLAEANRSVEPENRKTLQAGLFLVAGAGFEPATSGL